MGPSRFVASCIVTSLRSETEYSEEEYQQGMAISQTMPGPLAAQLAKWLGYLERGWLGALAVSVPFVLAHF